MGWSGPGRKTTVQALKEDVMSGFSPDVTILKVASTCYGSRLWVAVKHKGESYVVLYLLDATRGMTKGMSEDMGPYYYDCPLSLLNLTRGVSIGFGGDWRDKVREYHSNRRNRKAARHV